MKTILITGGTGFIGSHVTEYLLLNTDWNIIILDRLDNTSSLQRLVEGCGHFDNWRERVKFEYHNLRSPIGSTLYRKLLKENINYVLHLGASTHVDRSITEPEEFIYDNVLGTHNLLWFCRQLENTLDKIIYFSTDEVFGSANPGVNYKEWDRYKSSNPYAATKAAGEELAIAYENTYKLPILVTHTMNVFGERQHKEKYIPLCIKKILKGDIIKIHGDPTKTKAGSRTYLYAKNVAQALLFLLTHGQIGDKYNIVGEKELTNLEVAQKIGAVLNKEPLYEIVDFHSSRPGHDFRYALDGEKMKNMGFAYNLSFEESLNKTIQFYQEHQEWLN